MQNEKIQTPNNGVHNSNSNSEFNSTTNNAETQQKTSRKTNDYASSLDNLPVELLSLKRFLNVRDDGKTPKGAGWNKPENQKLLAKIVTRNAAFFIKGTPNFLVLDFDNVLNDDKTFKNSAAQDFYNNFRAVFPNAYCEISTGGHGLHILLKPSEGKFTPIKSKAFDFDTTNNSKVEVFFDFNKTITLTGNIFDCEPNSDIPSGDVADDFISKLMKKIEVQNTMRKKEKKSAHRSFEHSLNYSDEFKMARAIEMLNTINPTALDDNEWLNVISAAKNIGIDYLEVDAWCAKDTGTNKDGKPRYNEHNNFERWQSISDTSYDIRVLYRIAERFGYDEKDFQRRWFKSHPNDKPPRAKRIPINDFIDMDNQGYEQEYEEMTQRLATTKAVFPDCPIDLQLPFPSAFRFTTYGILRYVTKYERFVPFCYTPIVVTKRLFLHPTNKIQYELAFLNFKDIWCFVTVEAETIADSKKIIQLANSGVGITSTEAKYLSAFLTELINFDTNKTTIPTEKIFQQIGWLDSSCSNFIFPVGGILDGENYIVKRGNYNYSEIFTPKGKSYNWTLNFIELSVSGAIVRFIFGTILLAPLVKPFNLMNVWLHIHGPSSSGKTAVIKAAVSIFGNPDTKNGLGRTLDASKAYFMSVVSAFNSFPVLFDELENLPNKFKNENLQSLIYNYTGGTTGQRNTRNGEEREISTFNNVIATTGEQPISADNAKRGAVKRLLEVRYTKLFNEQTSRHYHKFFEKNYGHFGQKWIQYVIANLSTLQIEFEQLLDFMFNPSTNDSQIEKEFKQNLNNYDATNLKVVFAALFAYSKFATIIEQELHEKIFTFFNDFDDLKEIIAMLPTLSQLDETERAKTYLADFVQSHKKFFVREAPPSDTHNEEYGADTFEIYGKIYQNGDVAFFKTALTKIIEVDLKFSSCKKFLNECKDADFIKCDTDRLDVKRKIRANDKDKSRVYYFNKLIDVDD